MTETDEQLKNAKIRVKQAYCNHNTKKDNRKIKILLNANIEKDIKRRKGRL